MTHSNNNNSDRLSRIEALVESNARTIQAMMEQRASDQIRHEQTIAEIRANINSNSRSIQAMMEQQATDRLKHEEAMNQMRELMTRMAETQSGLTRILINHDEDRPTILRRLMSIENKVDQILDRNPE